MPRRTSSNPDPSTMTRKLIHGPFELDLTLGRLTLQGDVVPLERRPFEVLRTLVEARGALVSRDEFRETYWQGYPRLEFDKSLNTAIRKVREAIGDSARRPTQLETYRGRGYRLLPFPAEAEPQEDGALATRRHDPIWLLPAAEPRTNRDRLAHRQDPIWPIMAIAAVTLLVLSAWLRR